MQILLNSDKEIIAYAEIGGFENGIEAEISQNVLGDNPLSYKYIDGELIKNANYISPTDTVKTVDEQIQSILTKVDELNSSVDLLFINSL